MHQGGLQGYHTMDHRAQSLAARTVGPVWLLGLWTSGHTAKRRWHGSEMTRLCGGDQSCLLLFQTSFSSGGQSQPFQGIMLDYPGPQAAGHQ